MTIHQHATIADTVYFWFGSNDTSGSGNDGAAAAADVRLAGAAAGAIPVLSPVPTLLTHANYPPGAYEVAVAATVGNGFAATNTYAVFCTLTVDGENPTGFVGSFTLDPIIANIMEISDDSTAADNLELDYDGTGYAKANSTIGTTTTNTDLVTAAAVVNEWETQSQADPTGFHVNVYEIGDTPQTANDNGADINEILVDTGEIGVAGAGLSNINLPNQTMDIVGSITGNLSGSVGSVTGAVGSVTGAVGSVTGAVGSVTGNIGGNVAGTVASVVGAVGSVTGAVGSVTGNVGGNVTGSVASVAGSVGGNVTGSVGSVIGAVGSVTGAVGSVTGAVGSVTGNVGGNVTGTVASVVGNVGGTVASVVGNVGGNLAGDVQGNVDGSVASVTGNVGGTVASIVGNLGGDVVGDVQGNVTGSVGSVVGAVGSVTGAVGSVTGNVGGNVAGTVASVVGNVGGNVTGSVASVAAGGISAASFAANAVNANALATDAAQEIADTTLGRNLATVAGAAARSLLEAVRFLRNRWTIAGGTLTVYEEDDLTPSWTAAVSTAVSDPVDEIDPA